MWAGLHHVQLSVEPELAERARWFYIELLGMTEIPDAFPGKGFWLSAGGQDVHIRYETGIDRLETRAHPAFIVDNLSLLRQTLTTHGFVLMDQPVIKGFDRFHVLDPSGNRLEIMQRV